MSPPRPHPPGRATRWPRRPRSAAASAQRRCRLRGGARPARPLPARRHAGSRSSRSTSARSATRPAATATSTPGRTAREMMTPGDRGRACLELLAPAPGHPHARHHRRRAGAATRSSAASSTAAAPSAGASSTAATSPSCCCPRQRDLAGFLAEHRVEVIASLPYFRAAGPTPSGARACSTKIDRGAAGAQRARLRHGRTGPRAEPRQQPGRRLPAAGDQAPLERDCKRELERAPRHRVRPAVHHHQHADQPLPRAPRARRATCEAYLARLVSASTRRGRRRHVPHDLSVGWDGTLYDCDFNQMLEPALEPRGAADALRAAGRRPRRPAARGDRSPLLRLHRRARAPPAGAPWRSRLALRGVDWHYARNPLSRRRNFIGGIRGRQED